MQNRPTSISFLRIVAVCAALFAGSNAFAVLLLNLTFDDNTLAVNSTGTFTLSGSGTSFSSSSSGWQANEPGSTAGWFTLYALTVDTHGVDITNNGTFFSPNIANSQFFYAGGGTGLVLNGAIINSSTNTLQIGNGTTDFISGTFRISSSPGLGSLGIADLNQTGTRYTVTASPVPEPATYPVLAGVAVLGFACVRRRRRSA